MFSRVLGWLFSMIFAFSLGAGISHREPTDSELQQKVQDHMDVIVDESAAIVDDITEEIRKNEDVQKAEQFADDVREIVDNTVNDIHEHFDEETESVYETEGDLTETVSEEAETEQETAG